MFGMYTYVPCNGLAYSPFGYGFYSPYTVWQAPYYGGGGVAGGGGGIRRPTFRRELGRAPANIRPFMPSGVLSFLPQLTHRAADTSGGGTARSGGYQHGIQQRRQLRQCFARRQAVPPTAAGSARTHACRVHTRVNALKDTARIAVRALNYFRFFSKKSVVFSSNWRRTGPPTPWLFCG